MRHTRGVGIGNGDTKDASDDEDTRVSEKREPNDNNDTIYY
jgi:hypothetical protein